MKLLRRSNLGRRGPLKWLALTTAGAVATVSAVAVPAGAGAGAGAPASAPPRITWQPCTDAAFLGMDCGTLEVPVDYTSPEGARVSLAVVRRPATDKAHHLGTLALNDGAGGSSIEQFRLALGVGFADTVLAQRFDIVAMDPRGVGHSQGIHCTRPARAPGITSLPASQAEFNALVANNQAFAANCLKANGPLLTHMDMASTARDFEPLRIALHERQLNWYGITYSDLLGRTYAQLFPGRLRTMVLDTAIDDALSPVERLTGEMATAEASFGRFAAWCHADTSCPLHGTDVAASYDRLVASANRSPIPVKGTTATVTGQDIQAATQHFLSISFTWPPLAAAIGQALDGDATAFTHDADQTILDHVQLQAPACLDQPLAATTYAGLARLERLAHKISPHLGGQVESWTNMTGCLGWPAPAHSPAPAHAVMHAPAALIVESTHQSLSAYRWAFGLAAQLPGSRVLSVIGGDYSTYLLSSCVAKYTDNYLVNRTLPSAGAVCH